MEGNNFNQQSNLNSNQANNIPGVQPNVGTNVSNTNHINNISDFAANKQVSNSNINSGVGINPNGAFNQVNSNVTPNYANNMGNVNGLGVQSSYGYVEPPKKKNSFLTFLVIFLILALAAVGGYFAGQYIYNVTH